MRSLRSFVAGVFVALIMVWLGLTVRAQGGSVPKIHACVDIFGGSASSRRTQRAACFGFQLRGTSKVNQDHRDQQDRQATAALLVRPAQAHSAL